MSLNTVEKVKTNKPFRWLDIVVYAVLLAIILILFISVFISNSNSNQLTKIQASYDGQVMFTYDFDGDEFYISDNFLLQVEKGNNEKGYIVKLYEDKEKTEYNIIQIEKQKRCVYVIDTNCSSSKDCMLMYLGNTKQSIVCLPHKLVIEPLEKNEDDGLIVG